MTNALRMLIHPAFDNLPFPYALEHVLRETEITTKPITEEELKTTPDQKWILEIIPIPGILPYRDIYDLLSPFVINEITQGNGTLVINFAGEGETFPVYSELFNMFDIHGELFNNIVYCTGSLNIEKRYNQWRLEYNIPDNFNIINILFPGLENLSYPHITEVLDSTDKFIPSSSTNRNKMFLSFNRLFRRHRMYFVYKLYKSDLLEHGYTSMFLHDGCHPISEAGRHDKNIDVMVNEMMHLLPMLLDCNTGTRNLLDTLAINLHRDSYFSIVSCTQFYSDSNRFHEDETQLTEKPLKPIISKQPFLIIGNRHYLKDMREYGYRTFGKWINESYDDIVDDEERMDAILEETRRLCSISKDKWDKIILDMESTLLYNYNYYMEANNRRYTQRLGLHNLLIYTETR